MKKYLTPDFDVTVYELEEKITAANILSGDFKEEDGGSKDDGWSDIV